MEYQQEPIPGIDEAFFEAEEKARAEKFGEQTLFAAEFLEVEGE